ncbi:protein of unknown function (plasmid) [Pararobbsia alpina]
MELLEQGARKGLNLDEAKRVASQLKQDRQKALDALVREELGLGPDKMSGNPWTAAEPAKRSAIIRLRSGWRSAAVRCSHRTVGTAHLLAMHGTASRVPATRWYSCHFSTGAPEDFLTPNGYAVGVDPLASHSTRKVPCLWPTLSATLYAE